MAALSALQLTVDRHQAAVLCGVRAHDRVSTVHLWHGDWPADICQALVALHRTAHVVLVISGAVPFGHTRDEQAIAVDVVSNADGHCCDRHLLVKSCLRAARLPGTCDRATRHH